MRKLLIEGLAAQISETPDTSGDRLSHDVRFVHKPVIPMLYNHKGSIVDRSYDEDYLPIGAWSKFERREDGLFVKGSLIGANHRNEELIELVKAGAISCLSTGQRILKSEIISNSGEKIVTKLLIYEVSLVPFPAHDDCIITKWEEIK